MKTALSLVTVVTIATGCAAGVAGAGAPIAVLVCPSEPVRAGDDFFLDGSQTGDASSFASITLQVGESTSANLSDTFTAPAGGHLLATLTVVDEQKNTASASCKVNVLPIPPAGGFDISGTWAMVAYDNPRLTGGALDPAPQCALAPQISLVHVGLEGANATMTMKTCSISLPQVQVGIAGIQALQSTVVPDAFLDLFPEVGPFTFAMTDAGFTPPLTQLGAPIVLGANLPAPDAPLPTTDDGSLTDPDEDTNLGVPIVVDGFLDINIVYRRTLRALSGTVVSADEIDGSAPGSYQLDSDSALFDGTLNGMVPAGAGQPSTFKMTRVDDDADCASLRAQAAALIAAAPPPAFTDGCASFENAQ